MIQAILIAFLVGFVFYPVFMRLIYPWFIDELSERLTEEKKRVLKKKKRHNGNNKAKK